MTSSFGIYTFLEPYPMEDRRRSCSIYLLESSSRHCDACREGHNPPTITFVFHVNSFTIGITRFSTEFVAQLGLPAKSAILSVFISTVTTKSSISQVLAYESDHCGTNAINVDIVVHPLWPFLNILIFGARRSVGLSGKLMTAISSTCSFSQTFSLPYI